MTRHLAILNRVKDSTFAVYYAPGRDRRPCLTKPAMDREARSRQVPKQWSHSPAASTARWIRRASKVRQAHGHPRQVGPDISATTLRCEPPQGPYDLWGLENANLWPTWVTSPGSAKLPRSYWRPEIPRYQWYGRPLRTLSKETQLLYSTIWADIGPAGRLPSTFHMRGCVFLSFASGLLPGGGSPAHPRVPRTKEHANLAIRKRI